jgi:hypothetical protein
MESKVFGYFNKHFPLRETNNAQLGLNQENMVASPF